MLTKIQNCIALQNLVSIISHSDGIIISRGGLALSLSPAHLAFVQDYIFDKCKQMGKPVMMSGSIMESMARCPIPTRAEVADTILAITQGVDALVLGGEPALGEFYLEALHMMCKICIETESRLNPRLSYIKLTKYSFVPRNGNV